jgi:formate dehydrogenase
MAIAAALFCYGHANQPISAQARYAAVTRGILECWFKGRQIRNEYLIVYRGKLAGTDAHSYRVGDR